MENQDKTDPTTTALPTAEPTLLATSSVESAPAEKPPIQNLISIDDFMRTELRVAQIETVEAIPKSKKLLKLSVNLGETLGKRQILAGVAPYFPDASVLVGRKIVIVANLQPAKLMGLESQGMLLAGSSEDGSMLNLVDPGQDMPIGSRVR